MSQPNRCEICGEPTERPVEMCSACIRSYASSGEHPPNPFNGKSIGLREALLWAARRARWYAERRAAKNARAAVEREGRKARR